MFRFVLLAAFCTLILTACGGRSVPLHQSGPGSVKGMQAVADHAPAVQQRGDSRRAVSRLYDDYRRNGRLLRLYIQPSAHATRDAAASGLDATAVRRALDKDFDALYLLFKAAPNAVVRISASGPRAGALASSLADHLSQSCNLDASRLQTVAQTSASTSGAAGLELLVAAPRTLARLDARLDARLEARLEAGPAAPVVRQDRTHVSQSKRPLQAHTDRPAGEAHSVAAIERPQAVHAVQKSSAPAARPAAEKLVLRFNSGHAALEAGMAPQIAAIAARLEAEPNLHAILEGHSDNRGSAENNRLLSYQRALAVQIALITDHGIAPERLEVQGLGESAPVADNASERGRRLNRRVAVRFKSAAPVAAVATAASATAQAAALDLRFGVPQSLSAPATKRGVAAAKPPLAAEVHYTPLPQQRESRRYRIEISVSKCTLWLYEVMADGSKRLVRPFQVATARPGTPWPRGEGSITGIDYSPWWYPTDSMKRRARKIGKRLVPVPPGASHNPMGAVKIMLSHMNHGGAYRIHGTNQPWLIGRRVSLGCIRMRNEDSLELARTVPVGTPVDIQY